MTGEHELAAEGIRLRLDLRNGHIVDCVIEAADRPLRPLHRAPWVDSGEELPDGTSLGLARLSGDFFCAPFSRSDLEDAPVHGWPANSAWGFVEQEAVDGGGVSASFRLQRPVLGATIEKQITLRANHPFVYQEHRLRGGSGLLSVSHHLMTRMKAGGLLASSPKRFAQTPDAPLEPDPARGRFALAYPAHVEDLSAFPLAQGGTKDLRIYPPAERHEDFLTLAEDAGAGLGWTAISRHAEQDMVLVLKNAETLPITMLWMSNGGRNYPPWNARHTGVLGIEDARAHPGGHRASTGENSLTAQGVPTAFKLDGETLVVRQAFGAVPLAETAVPVVAVSAGDGALKIVQESGAVLRLPFDDTFLAV
ncbi:hypothetical protein [Tianweitania sediminis]|uniref:Uncharacterized protein n=1 Tax=Tianweitania sediminis TaxID=1502156 RepID=A0A8J7UI00_9HYPH|nr:hypothetical protein [Tianweitania sediminis]MBP0437250.1 hypothetical protein [Tianweitania sediminis]